MLITTDGSAYVFGVFGADGYECEFLEAVFSSEQAANTYVSYLRSEANSATYRFYGKPELLSVKPLHVLGEVHIK